jgi:hypothetical protein
MGLLFIPYALSGSEHIAKLAGRHAHVTPEHGREMAVPETYRLCNLRDRQSWIVQ